jgi:chromosome segregation ATPase
MEPRVKILDDHSLEELQEAQCFASDSILKVVAHVSEFLDSMIEAMEEQKKVLEEQVEEARERLEHAEEAYSNCLSSQKYDEEDHCYRPSCDSQAARVDSCREEYDDLKERDEKAEHVLSDSKGELSKYREPGGIITPPGGEALMKYLAKGHTDKANEKMDKIRKCVSNYLSVSCSIRDAKIQRNAEQAQMYEEGVRELEEKAEADEKQAKKDKAEAFRDATTSMQKKMSEMGYRDANAIAICPGCKRPVNVCICQHIRERSR